MSQKFDDLVTKQTEELAELICEEVSSAVELSRNLGRTDFKASYITENRRALNIAVRALRIMLKCDALISSVGNCHTISVSWKNPIQSNIPALGSKLPKNIPLANPTGSLADPMADIYQTLPRFQSIVDRVD